MSCVASWRSKVSAERHPIPVFSQNFPFAANRGQRNPEVSLNAQTAEYAVGLKGEPQPLPDPARSAASG